MSSAPTGTSAPSLSRIASAMRRASGTPRRWMPMSSRPSVPACFSTISWERRIVARRISSAVMIRRPVIAPSRPHRAMWQPHGTAFEGSGTGYGRRWPRAKVASVHVHRDVDDAAPRWATADLEEVRAIHVDDPLGGLRSVVGHDPFEAATLGTHDDDRATGQPHGGGPVVVERGLARELVLLWLALRLLGAVGLIDDCAWRRL